MSLSVTPNLLHTGQIRIEGVVYCGRPDCPGCTAPIAELFVDGVRHVAQSRGHTARPVLVPADRTSPCHPNGPRVDLRTVLSFDQIAELVTLQWPSPYPLP